MRLGTLTLSATLSAALLSGCSFVGGQPTNNGNPYAKQNVAHQGQYGQQRYGQQAAGQNCQIASPRQPIPRGCRPEQVTIGTSAQQRGYGAQGGFSQQPQFGQPQYTDGGYGSAVGQTAAVAHNTSGPKKRKPKLRGSLSISADPSISGTLLDFGIRDDLNPANSFNPQDFNTGSTEGSEASGLVTTTRYTANDSINNIPTSAIFTPNGSESVNTSNVLFEDAWSVPINIKGGLEYILNDNTTIFANGGYTSADGQTRAVSTVDATIYRQVTSQAFTPVLDAAGAPISGSFIENGPPNVITSFVPNQQIATFSTNFSDLEQYDLEVGARHYFKPVVKSEGFRTVTPFVGASVGVSRVNAIDITSSQTQGFYSRLFDGDTEDTTFDIPTDGTSTRIYDSEWLPQGQLNVGAEWQVTPGFALAAETGIKVQASREYADFNNAAGETVSGRNGDTNVSIPLTLRGSINF